VEDYELKGKVSEIQNHLHIQNDLDARTELHLIPRETQAQGLYVLGVCYDSHRRVLLRL
jgi:hypothetical protein